MLGGPDDISDDGIMTARVLKKKAPEVVTSSLTDREVEILRQAIACSPAVCAHVFTAASRSPRDRNAVLRVTPRMLRDQVQAACRIAGIADFKPHDFRHTFGSRMMRKTGDLTLTQSAMDHSDIKSTLRYTHVLQDDVLKARALVTVTKTSRSKAAEGSDQSERKRSA